MEETAAAIPFVYFRSRRGQPRSMWYRQACKHRHRRHDAMRVARCRWVVVVVVASVCRRSWENMSVCPSTGHIRRNERERQKDPVSSNKAARDW